MATDFTHMDELGITINGEPYRHLLCHCVLTYSNWEWATICRSESLPALRNGIQAALFRLGHVPRRHWTDNSSAATHRPGKDDGTDRRFNDNYRDLMKHFGMEPRTIQVGAAHENGDVESLNGVLKRRIKQYLLLRGHGILPVSRSTAVSWSRCLKKPMRSEPKDWRKNSSRCGS
jgi:transposase InsO family protein